MVSEKVMEYSENIVKLHDGNSFDALKQHISGKAFEVDSWFTEDRYLEVCEDINRNVGVFCKMSFIDKLSQGEKVLTLWKAKYSNSDSEVFWSICFDNSFSQVLGLHVEW